MPLEPIGVSRSLFPCGVPLIFSLVYGCQTPAPPSPEVTVAGTDYAFEVPAQLPAGLTRFRFENKGKVPHEMALGQLKAGVTADSLLAYAAAGHDPGDLADGIVGILIADPGTPALGSLTADLAPGRTYMMICNFRDADSLPPHMVMGMQASFTVQ